MTKPLSIAGQVLLYAAFAAAIGVFSQWPSYRALGEGQALITLSMVLHGQRIEPCRELAAEELAALPPNMRAPIRCGRERAPLSIEVDLDGQAAHRQTAIPGGLSRDGVSALYHRMPVAAGSHRIEVRLRDSTRAEGFDYHAEATVMLRPEQVLVLDFDHDQRRITLR